MGRDCVNEGVCVGCVNGGAHVGGCINESEHVCGRHVHGLHE
jgi:hypothetical protein